MRVLEILESTLRDVRAGLWNGRNLRALISSHCRVRRHEFDAAIRVLTAAIDGIPHLHHFVFDWETHPRRTAHDVEEMLCRAIRRTVPADLPA